MRRLLISHLRNKACLLILPSLLAPAFKESTLDRRLDDSKLVEDCLAISDSSDSSWIMERFGFWGLRMVDVDGVKDDCEHKDVYAI